MNFDNIPEQRPIRNPHPRAEQILMSIAVERLSPRQKLIWKLWNNERLTQDEIAKKIGIRQEAVSQQIVTIERKLTKYLEMSKGAYLLLKLEQKIMNEETES